MTPPSPAILGSGYDLRSLVEQDGFARIERPLDARQAADLREALGRMPGPDRRRGGRRDALAVPHVRELVRAGPVREAAAAVLGADCFAVRALFFDKTPTANWHILWHQDLTVTVRDRIEVPGFGPWTTKGGVAHALAPDTVLQKMVAVRVHLDDCGEDDGPLMVLPGSHAEGRLTPDDVRRWKARGSPATCLVEAGDLLLMRPLVLHASTSARAPGHRRVLHVEFVTCELPGGLEWAERV